MFNRRQKLFVVFLIASLTLGARAAEARPKAKASDLTNYTVIHAIPAGYGADVVDVYANGILIIDNAVPGAVKSFAVPRGNLKVQIYANGVVPGATTVPLLSSQNLYLTNGNSISFVAHLGADEKPRFSEFKNMVTEAGSKRSWISVRNVAAAPALQVRVNGYPTFVPLLNSMERKKSFAFGSYSVDAIYSDGGAVAFVPTSVKLEKGKNVVLYVWGAKSKGNIAVLKEEVLTRK